jgi:hypothetical protein
MIPTKDLESGDFERESDDVTSVMCVIRKEAGGDCGRMDDAAVVEDLESVSTTQGDSMNNGATVSTVINKRMIYLQYCNKQNDGMTDTSMEKKDDEVNHIVETQELGQSKRKRIPRRRADALNGCLCGLVLNGLSSWALKCKQAGCETQWVSNVVLAVIQVHNVTYIVY